MEKNKTDHMGWKGIDQILNGISDIIEKLGRWVEKGDNCTGEGRFYSSDKKICTEYKWSVKFGINQETGQAQEKRDKAFNTASVKAVCDPRADLFEEDDHTLVVVEMPGIRTRDVNITIKNDVLILSAGNGGKQYKKEMRLPGSYSADRISYTCSNGILEIKCMNWSS